MTSICRNYLWIVLYLIFLRFAIIKYYFTCNFFEIYNFGGIFLKEKTKDTAKTPAKFRDCAFLLYPDSCNPKWLEILTQLQQPFFWILHDSDVNADGSEKKPHYHIMIMFENPRSVNSITKIALMCGGNGHLEQIISRRGYARYLCHMDNPDKFQYPETCIHALCGADYSKETISLAEVKANKVAMIIDILQFIDIHQIHIYADLIRYCACSRTDWLEILMSFSGQLIKDYIRSEAYDYKDKSPTSCFHRFNFEKFVPETTPTDTDITPT